MSDTIAAIATGNVLSAIGILRLSGDGVLTVIDRVFRPANGRPMSEAPDRKLVYGAFCDTDGQTLDLCLCTVSRAPPPRRPVDTQCGSSSRDIADRDRQRCRLRTVHLDGPRCGRDLRHCVLDRGCFEGHRQPSKRWVVDGLERRQPR